MTESNNPPLPDPSTTPWNDSWNKEETKVSQRSEAWNDYVGSATAKSDSATETIRTNYRPRRAERLMDSNDWKQVAIICAMVAVAAAIGTVGAFLIMVKIYL